jgi:hypothetical protein
MQAAKTRTLRGAAANKGPFPNAPLFAAVPDETGKVRCIPIRTGFVGLREVRPIVGVVIPEEFRQWWTATSPTAFGCTATGELIGRTLPDGESTTFGENPFPNAPVFAYFFVTGGQPEWGCRPIRRAVVGTTAATLRQVLPVANIPAEFRDWKSYTNPEAFGCTKEGAVVARTVAANTTTTFGEGAYPNAPVFGYFPPTTENPVGRCLPIRRAVVGTTAGNIREVVPNPAVTIPPEYREWWKVTSPTAFGCTKEGQPIAPTTSGNNATTIAEGAYPNAPTHAYFAIGSEASQCHPIRVFSWVSATGQVRNVVPVAKIPVEFQEWWKATSPTAFGCTREGVVVAAEVTTGQQTTVGNGAYPDAPTHAYFARGADNPTWGCYPIRKTEFYSGGQLRSYTPVTGIPPEFERWWEATPVTKFGCTRTGEVVLRTLPANQTASGVNAAAGAYPNSPFYAYLPVSDGEYKCQPIRRGFDGVRLVSPFSPTIPAPYNEWWKYNEPGVFGCTRDGRPILQTGVESAPSSTSTSTSSSSSTSTSTSSSSSTSTSTSSSSGSTTTTTLPATPASAIPDRYPNAPRYALFIDETYPEPFECVPIRQFWEGAKLVQPTKLVRPEYQDYASLTNPALFGCTRTGQVAVQSNVPLGAFPNAPKYQRIVGGVAPTCALFRSFLTSAVAADSSVTKAVSRLLAENAEWWKKTSPEAFGCSSTGQLVNSTGDLYPNAPRYVLDWKTVTCKPVREFPGAPSLPFDPNDFPADWWKYSDPTAFGCTQPGQIAMTGGKPAGILPGTPTYARHPGGSGLAPGCYPIRPVWKSDQWQLPVAIPLTPGSWWEQTSVTAFGCSATGEPVNANGDSVAVTDDVYPNAPRYYLTTNVSCLPIRSFRVNGRTVTAELSANQLPPYFRTWMNETDPEVFGCTRDGQPLRRNGVLVGMFPNKPTFGLVSVDGKPPLCRAVRAHLPLATLTVTALSSTQVWLPADSQAAYRYPNWWTETSADAYGCTKDGQPVATAAGQSGDATLDEFPNAPRYALAYENGACYPIRRFWNGSAYVDAQYRDAPWVDSWSTKTDPNIFGCDRQGQRVMSGANVVGPLPNSPTYYFDIAGTYGLVGECVQIRPRFVGTQLVQSAFFASGGNIPDFWNFSTPTAFGCSANGNPIREVGSSNPAAAADPFPTAPRYVLAANMPVRCVPIRPFWDGTKAVVPTYPNNLAPAPYKEWWTFTDPQVFGCTSAGQPVRNGTEVVGQFPNSPSYAAFATEPNGCMRLRETYANTNGVQPRSDNPKALGYRWWLETSPTAYGCSKAGVLVTPVAGRGLSVPVQDPQVPPAPVTFSGGRGFSVPMQIPAPAPSSGAPEQLDQFDFGSEENGDASNPYSGVGDSSSSTGTDFLDGTDDIDAVGSQALETESAKGTDALTKELLNRKTVHFEVTYPNISTLVEVEVTATDKYGRVAKDRVAITDFQPILGGEGCAAGAVFNIVWELLRQGKPAIITLPIGSINLGVLSLVDNPDKPAEGLACLESATLKMENASFSFFEGQLSASGLGLTLSKERICFTVGTVALAPQMKLPQAVLNPNQPPLCISLNTDKHPTPTTAANAPPPAQVDTATTPPPPAAASLTSTPACPGQTEQPITGSLTWPTTSFPLFELPNGFVARGFRLDFLCDSAKFSATADFPSGPQTAKLALDGRMYYGGGFSAGIGVTDLSLLGGTASLAGRVQIPASGPVSFDVNGQLLNPNLGIQELEVQQITVGLDNRGPNNGLRFSFSGNGAIKATAAPANQQNNNNVQAGSGATRIPFDIRGAYRSSEDWEFAVNATLANSFSPIANMRLDGATLSGSVKRFKPAPLPPANPPPPLPVVKTVFNVLLDVNGAWAPVPEFTLRSVKLRVTNETKTPGLCPDSITDGSVWVSLEGAATIAIPNTAPIDLTAGACAAPAQGAFKLKTLATADGWTPVPGGDLRLDRIQFTVERTDVGQWKFDADAALRFKQVTLGARLEGRTKSSSTANDDYFVIDGWVGNANVAATGSQETADPVAELGITGMSAIHIVYASRPIALYENKTTTGAFTAKIPQGLSVLGRFALPDGAGDLIRKVGAKADAPSANGLLVIATFNNGLIRIKAELTAKGAAGIVMFESCPEKKQNPNAACTNLNETTRLTATGAFLEVTLGAGQVKLAIGAQGILNLPATGDVSEDASNGPSTLELTFKATLGIGATGPSLTISMFTTGNWNNAFGVQGLIMADMVIQGGIDFSTPIPTPSIGMGATVVQLPEDIRTKLGIVNNERMRFVFNISIAAPILEITLGEKNGQTFIRPLALADPNPATNKNINAVLVDYASLVIAPRGGEVGPYIYQPGISIGFAATISGVGVDIAATIDIPNASVSADVEIGAFTVGKVNLKKTDLELRINPSQIKFELSGGFEMQDGSASLDLYVLIDANIAQGGFRIKVQGDGDNIPLLPGFTLEEFRLIVDMNIGASELTGGDFKLLIDAYFKFNVLGAKPSIKAKLLIDKGDLQQLQAQLAIEPIIVAGTGITGDGCDGVSGPEQGICVKIDYDKITAGRENSPFEFVLTGAVSVVGIQARITMSYDKEGFFLEGSLAANPVGEISVTGRFYRKTATQAVTPPTKNAVPILPTDGNFTLSGKGYINIADIIRSELNFSIGNVGTGSARATWVQASGAITSEVFKLQVSGEFSTGADNKPQFELAASGSLTIAGQQLASVSGKVNNKGFDLKAAVTLPQVDVGNGPKSLGGISVDGRIRFAGQGQDFGFFFQGAGSLNDPWTGNPAIQGSLLVANMGVTQDPATGLLVAVNSDVVTGLAVQVNAAVTIPVIELKASVVGRIFANTDKSLGVYFNGSLSITPPLLGVVRATVGFGFNNPDPWSNGVWASAQALDILFDAKVTQAGFGIELRMPADKTIDTRVYHAGPINLLGVITGAKAEFGFSGKFTGPPLKASAKGTGKVSVYVYPAPPPGSPPPAYNEVTVGLSFQTDPRLKACVMLGLEFCSPEIVT